MHLLWLKMYTPIVDSDEEDAPSGVQEHYELEAGVSEHDDDAAAASTVAPSPTLSVRDASAEVPSAREKSGPPSLRELRFRHSVPTSSWEAS